MKVKFFPSLTILLSLCCLTGCSSVDSFLSKKMLEKSGITANEEYVAAQEYQAQGIVDNEGVYQEPESIEERNVGTVRVTFSRNNNLDVTYYLDAQKNNKIVDDYFHWRDYENLQLI